MDVFCAVLLRRINRTGTRFASNECTRRDSLLSIPLQAVSEWFVFLRLGVRVGSVLVLAVHVGPWTWREAPGLPLFHGYLRLVDRR